MLKIARLCAEYLLENIMSGCCTIPPREAPAIPLWINGRPMLAMPLRFHEVREAATQRLIRRVPIVDAELAASALNVAQQATGLPLAEVSHFLGELSQALEELEGHFAGLSAVESHTHLEAGKADVAHAIEFVQQLAQAPLNADAVDHDLSVLALAGAGLPLSAALKLVLPMLLQGRAVTLVPDADAPSCALALAELCGQCGLPDGLFNVVYVDDTVALSLILDHGVQQVRLFGPSAWAQRWQTAAMNWPDRVRCELVPA